MKEQWLYFTATTTVVLMIGMLYVGSHHTATLKQLEARAYATECQLVALQAKVALEKADTETAISNIVAGVTGLQASSEQITELTRTWQELNQRLGAQLTGMQWTLSNYIRFSQRQ